jgi:hypothetical protein
MASDGSDQLDGPPAAPLAELGDLAAADAPEDDTD